jgi:hypothetical protein
MRRLLLASAALLALAAGPAVAQVALPRSGALSDAQPVFCVNPTTAAVEDCVGSGGGGGGNVTQGTSPWVDDIAQVGGANITLGQAAKAASIPVTIASDQGATAVTGTFWQATQPVSIASMPSTPVTGTFWQATQPVSLASLPALAAGSSTIGALTANQSVNETEIGGSNIVTGGVAGSQAVGGPTATSASFAANPLPDGGEAFSAEPSAATSGHPVVAERDLVGKDITSPYANRENMARGYATETGTSAGTVLAASGASGVKEYLTDLECYNTSATTITVAINDSASTSFIVPSGGGFMKSFNVPLTGTANTAMTFTASTGETTIGCAGQGFYGY